MSKDFVSNNIMQLSSSVLNRINITASGCSNSCCVCYETVCDMSLKMLPRKVEYKCKIIHAKGLAYEMLRDYENSIRLFQREIELAMKK